jgi:predicted membrane metal-binding protein
VLSLIALAVGIADRRFTTITLWLVAFLALAYVVVYGLGLGFFYLPTAGLLVGAAVVRTVKPRPLGDDAVS